MNVSKLEVATLGIAKMVVKTVDLDSAGEPQEKEKMYNLVLDFNALATAQEKTGLDFMKVESWRNLSLANLRALCWSAFRRFHPHVTEEQVGQMVPPASEGAVWSMLIELAFPGILENIRKATEEAQKSGAPSGESQPAAEANATS